MRLTKEKAAENRTKVVDAALAQVIRNMREWVAEYVRHAWSRRDEARPKPCQ